MINELFIFCPILCLSLSLSHQVNEQGYAHAVGRRKTAVAQVWLKRGTGQIVINDKPFLEFFGYITERLVTLIIMRRLVQAQRSSQINFYIKYFLTAVLDAAQYKNKNYMYVHVDDISGDFITESSPVAKKYYHSLCMCQKQFQIKSFVY